MEQSNPYQPPKAEVVDIIETPTTELATRGARLGASFVDGLVLIAIIFPVMYFTGYWTSAMSGSATRTQTILVSLFSFIVSVALNAYLLTKYGQTIGKRVIGTRIVAIDDDQILPLGKIISLRMAPIQLASLIPVIGNIFAFVDTLFIFRKDHRCLHDLIAGTRVVSASVPWKDRQGAAGV